MAVTIKRTVSSPRPNTVRTSNLSWISRRKHATQISFLIFSDICSRLLGKLFLTGAIMVVVCTYFLCIENMQKFLGKELLKPSKPFQMLRLKQQNRNGLIWHFQMMSIVYSEPLSHCVCPIVGNNKQFFSY